MSTTLKIVNSLEVESRGQVLTASQGHFDAAPTDTFDTTVNGECVQLPFTLATADAVVLWDGSSSPLDDFEYLHYVCDQDTFLQLITAAAQVVIACKAYKPQTIGAGTILPAASTTALTGSATPSVVSVAKIVACNRSGNSTDGVLTLVR